MATMSAVSGQLAASTNHVLAVAVICFAYCGYWLAVFAALENDFVSWASTLLLTLFAFGEAVICLANAVA